MNYKLNNYTYGTFTSTWQSKIANVMWKVGGGLYNSIAHASTMADAYEAEITNLGQNVTYSPTDSVINYPAKIALIYATDYSYASVQSAWTYELYYYDDNNASQYNWLFRGVSEAFLTRAANTAGRAIGIHSL